MITMLRKDNLFETPPVMVTLSGATTAMPTFTAPSLDATTRLRFILSATDSTFSDPVASSTGVVITIVAQTNTQRPTAVAGSDQTVDEGATVTLTGGGVDPESATLTYQWEQVGGPSVLLTNADMRVATVKAPLGVGSNLALTFSLTTNDGDIDIDTTRVRLALEASQKRITAGGGLYEPSLEIGARYDGGDGENGVGLEVGGGVQYSNPITRVTVEGRVRGLLGHSGDYEEWGISGSVRLQPGSDGQGLSFNITPGYGESQSGIQALFNATNKADTTADPRPYMDARIGYGIPVPRWNALVTPYSELTIGTTDSYRLGINWKSGTRYTLTLSGERQERTTTPTHAVLLKGEVSF